MNVQEARKGSGFYSATAETTAKAMGVKRVSVPTSGTKRDRRQQDGREQRLPGDDPPNTDGGLDPGDERPETGAGLTRQAAEVHDEAGAGVRSAGQRLEFDQDRCRARVLGDQETAKDRMRPEPLAQRLRPQRASPHLRVGDDRHRTQRIPLEVAHVGG